MTINVLHTFHTPVTDAGDPDKVGPDEWNAEHTFSMDSGFYLGRTSAGHGAVEQISIGMEALTQVVDNDGDTAEVEAATKALRVARRPFGVSDGLNFGVARFAFADTVSYSLTTSGMTDNQFFGGAWAKNGVAQVKRLTVSIATTALSGARNGSGVIRLRRMGMLDNIGTSNIILPALGYTQGLLVNQQTPMLRLGSAAGFSFSAPSAVADTNDFGTIDFGAPNSVGTNVLHKTLFEARPGQPPLILTNWSGFVCTLSVPAAATSQTVTVAFNLLWDEWVPQPNC